MGESQKCFLEEKEITEKIDLCDVKGQLLDESIGWARSPHINCNIKGHFFRKKKWNYWSISSDEYFFTVSVANMDYAAQIFVCFLDYTTDKILEKSFLVSLGKGLYMTNNIGENLFIKNKNVNISMEYIESEIIIKVSVYKFEYSHLYAEFYIQEPKEMDTLNVVVPWDKNRFQFTSKQNCLPAHGRILIGEKIYKFNSEECFAALDFGRGVWPRNIMWNWASASGKQGDRIIGINLGAKWTDGTGISENAFYVDGKLHKVHEEVDFIYSNEDFLKSWKIHTMYSDNINLDFKPLCSRKSITNMLLIKSNFNQIFGEFSGHITTQDGEKIEIKNLKGCVEEHIAKW